MDPERIERNNNPRQQVRFHQDDYQDTSQVDLKIVFVLSILLVTMDLFEVYFAFLHLKKTANAFEPLIFESCVKYHILSQIMFTIFATFAGISACFMSLGLLIDFDFFSNKVIDTFLYLNYLIFGPYLLAACILGYSNFDEVAYNCENGNYQNRYLNFSTLMALSLCVLVSVIITFSYSFAGALNKLMNSEYRPPSSREYMLEDVDPSSLSTR